MNLLKFNLQRFDGEGGDSGGDPGDNSTPKSKEDITAALKGMEGGAAYLAGFNSLLSVGNKAQGQVKKMQTQITTLTKERDTASGNFNKLLDFNGIPTDTENLDTKLQELREQQKKKDKTSVDAAVLQSKINELARNSKNIEKERDENKSLANKYHERIQSIIRDSSITKALKNSGALEYEALVPIFRNKVNILDDETAVYPLDDGSSVTVAEGVKMFFEKHPRLLANNQNPGGGSGGGTPGKIDIGKLSQTEYEKMRKEGKL